MATDASAKPPSSGNGFNNFLKFVALPGGVAGGAYYFYNQNQLETQARIKARLDKKAAENPVAALDGKTFLPFVLKEVVDVNHNTKRFRFALPEGTTELGLPTASCVVTKYVNGVKENGKPNVVIRPYTPVEDPADGYTGYFDLIVKQYPNGPMSTHIHSLKPGDTLDVKGPIKKYEYKANEFNHIGLLAGGTGITPMMQLIQRILSNPADKTKMTLVFANIAEEDILLKDYFDALAKKHPEQFEVRYFVEKPPIGWRGGVGYIGEGVIKEACPAPGKGKVFICGPNQMLASISGTKAPDYSQGEIGGILKKLG
ncbi:uncharacterized protein SPPG_05344 [Spizellomyces punctatus DAOM BR117]|uniref:NADH-cytochrome b5 reductase n=1 Tax=Spizellomyces punctatus (strain DAOM BR117) TaxID=645134 RepID=A0A0L0HGD2_SPIPD|nr:uncharacterized protein SPPG_05344 [Spizellomyces punctatus DAOM BR117]KNC99969.1 hypothetical protein SPPG_05344 [Spizellomyces punctatus DAOM BR117]|eukprot:XP_016608009.1 hypothetical protein SPPG_05344 [Spizellomyces punctatus DAOM BR117]